MKRKATIVYRGAGSSGGKRSSDQVKIRKRDGMMNGWRILVSTGLVAGMSLVTSTRAASALVVEGMAPGGTNSARQQALTDALRNAVKQGVGVDLVSSTRVTDFVLDYDRMMASAYGHVRSYRVLESGLHDDDIYRVKIRAEVESGAPDKREALVLRNIVQQKGSPRVSLEWIVDVEGYEAGSDAGKTVFEEMIKKMQLDLADVGRMVRQESRLSDRDRLLGADLNSRLRSLKHNADLIIQVELKGEYMGRRSIFDSRPRDWCSVSASLRAIVPDRGEAFAPTALKSANGSSSGGKSAALENAIGNVLRASDPNLKGGGWRFFSKVFAYWITQLDLGVIRKLEFDRLSNDDRGLLIEKLRNDARISAVWLREFDSRAFSTLEIETSLNAESVNEIIIEALGGRVQSDRFTPHFLQFRPGAKPPEARNRSSGGVPAKHSGTETEGAASRPPTPDRTETAGAGVKLPALGSFEGRMTTAGCCLAVLGLALVWARRRNG